MPTVLFELINTLVQIPISIGFVLVLTKDWKIRQRTAIGIFIGLAIILSAMDILMFHLLGINRMAKRVITALSFPACLITYMTLVGYRQGRALYVIFSGCIFAMMGAIVGEIIGDTSSLQRLVIKLGISGLLFLVVYYYIRPQILEMTEDIESSWNKMVLIPFSLCILCLLFLRSGRLYYDPVLQTAGVIFCFCIFCVFITQYYVFSQMKEQYRIKVAYNLLETQLNSVEEQVKAAQKANQQMTIFRHDMRHFMQIQAACLSSGDVEGARKVWNYMDRNLAEIGGPITRYTNSLIIDSLLFDYRKKAESNGITFSIKLEQYQEFMKESVEIAVVLANGLENAFHACMKIEMPGKREMRLTGRRQQKQYFLEIANTCTGDVLFDADQGDPVSREPHHGYGTCSIRAFAIKYKAYLEYKAENGWFYLRIIL